MIIDDIFETLLKIVLVCRSVMDIYTLGSLDYLIFSMKSDNCATSVIHHLVL